MDPVTALHTVARQYCIERSAFWRRHYAELVASGQAEVSGPGGGWSYSATAFDVFPRYQMLAAIQREVERFIPTDFSSFDDARQILELAGETAQSQFTKYSNPVAIAATQDERQKFSFFVDSADYARLASQPPLPFCRVLGTTEHQKLHRSVAQRWGKWYGGCVDMKEIASDVVTLHVAAMKEPESYEGLRAALIERGISRVFELRESGDGFEIETNTASFAYDGAEGFWTSGDSAWMVYSSHESSVTFGSAWLVERMRSLVPEFERYIYRGYDLAGYF